MAESPGQDLTLHPDSALTWAVGTVASRLGMSSSTLRTWERRYGVGPTGRTPGGHRRYTEADIARVELTSQLIARGAPPRDAARVAHSLDDRGVAEALLSGDIATGQGMPDAAQFVEHVVSAASEGDASRVRRLMADALRGAGVVDAWTDLFAPSLIRLGNAWSRGEIGIETEHLASECLLGELRAHTATFSAVDQATVVLTGAEDDQHALPVFALESAIAEHGIACHVLGARLPGSALESLVTRVRPQVVFVWASLARTRDDELWGALCAMPDSTRIVLGGPGWPAPEPDVGAGGPQLVTDLRSTVAAVLSFARTPNSAGC